MNAPYEITAGITVSTQEEEQAESYQVLITALSWNPVSSRAFRSKYDAKRELPEQMAFDIPQNVLENAYRAKDEFNDIIESYVYNALTRKFGHEVYSAQIWLPLEDE